MANDNAPGQIVIAGTFEGVEKAGAAALARGAKRVLPLKVGGAFHTPLMSSAQAPLDAAVREVGFSAPGCPVVANVDAQPHLAGFGGLLAAQLCSQVRWRESLITLAARGRGLRRARPGHRTVRDGQAHGPRRGPGQRGSAGRPQLPGRPGGSRPDKDLASARRALTSLRGRSAAPSRPAAPLPARA